VTPAQSFAEELGRYVRLDAAERHPAVDHPFLRRFAAGDFSRRRLHAYAINHFPLVEHFTKYLEYLLPLLPTRTAEDWRLKSLVAENLYQEYGEAVLGEDHPRLFVRFARSVGIEETLGLSPSASDEETAAAMLAHPWRLPAPAAFIARHDEMCRGDFLLGLGAIGPGHEWAIPTMFRSFVAGLARYGAAHGVTPDDRYYTTHIDVDVEHGAMLRELLVHHGATPTARARLQAGARLSLDLRAELWSAVDALWDRLGP
jgi:pyrroloquinoline quinone (PQQ) biosynthesis protein C